MNHGTCKQKSLPFLSSLPPNTKSTWKAELHLPAASLSTPFWHVPWLGQWGFLGSRGTSRLPMPCQALMYLFSVPYLHSSFQNCWKLLLLASGALFVTTRFASGAEPKPASFWTWTGSGWMPASLSPMLTQGIPHLEGKVPRFHKERHSSECQEWFQPLSSAPYSTAWCHWHCHPHFAERYAAVWRTLSNFCLWSQK